MTESVTLKPRGGVAWLRLNRPGAMNSITDELVDELSATLDGIKRDDSIRVVAYQRVSSVFCTGLDLKSVADDDGSVNNGKFLARVRRTSATVARIAALEKPTIAAVNGHALGAGMSIMMACDLVVAAEDAKIGDAHANHGAVSGSGDVVRLARIGGRWSQSI